MLEYVRHFFVFYSFLIIKFQQSNPLVPKARFEAVPGTSNEKSNLKGLGQAAKEDTKSECGETNIRVR